MAIKGRAAKAAKTSLLSLLRDRVEITTQKTKLWDTDNAEELISDVFVDSDSEVKLWMGVANESFFITIGEGDKSALVPFITGTVSAEDVDINEEDLNDNKTAYEFSDIEGFLKQMDADTIRVCEVTALRDEEFKNKAGEITASIVEGDTKVVAMLT